MRIIHFLIITTIFFCSCNSFSQKAKKAEDINVSELKFPCDYSEAMEIIVDELIELMKEEREWSLEKYSEEGNKLLDKYQEISTSFKRKYSNEDLKLCENYERLMYKIERL